jgi:type 1 glutamine amidotransferase
MNRRFALIMPVAALGASLFLVNAAAPAPKPLKVLLVTGGCCHDYETQRHLLASGMSERANIEVEFSHNPDKTTKATHERYKSADWAKGYDVVIHDECAADVNDAAYLANILNAHKAGTPAVNLHCAMHSYRSGEFTKPVAPGADNAGWFEFLGLQSARHGPQQPIDVTVGDPSHPITQGSANWTTIKEELYNNIQVTTGKALLHGKQSYKDKTGADKTDEAIVAWTNEYGENKTRVFSTTLGHNNETVGDARYLDVVTRGVLWAAGKIDATGKPVSGYEAKK